MKQMAMLLRPYNFFNRFIFTVSAAVAVQEKAAWQ